MIAARIAADDTLTTAVAAQSAADVIARAALQADVDANEVTAAAAVAAEVVRVNDLIATGMWLFANQTAFPSAAENHGRIVHSHADASMFYAHAGAWHKIENEAEAEAARLVIQNDVDANETASRTFRHLAKAVGDDPQDGLQDEIAGNRDAGNYGDVDPKAFVQHHIPIHQVVSSRYARPSA